jgi:hypothetical protein
LRRISKSRRRGEDTTTGCTSIRSNDTPRPGIGEFWEDGVVFRDGNRKRFDAIILATGYRSNYQSFLKFGGANKDARELGLFFAGYHNVVTGLLREISKESVRIAEYISGRLDRGA